MLDMRCLFGFHAYGDPNIEYLSDGVAYHSRCQRCNRTQRLAFTLAPLLTTDADLALLNSDVAQAKTPQEIGRGNLLALFGVEKKSATDI